MLHVSVPLLSLLVKSMLSPVPTVATAGLTRRCFSGLRRNTSDPSVPPLLPAVYSASRGMPSPSVSELAPLASVPK
jgi:hypothetical protein